ncbi:MAG: cytochrome P450 [Beijerinckiaceae bacterium]|nr:cytochrome P450 [Beijerinckiaceae bacterium]
MLVPNFIRVLGVRIRMVAEGFAALYQVPVAVLSARGSTLREKIAASAFDPYVQRLGFRALRAFLPNVRVPWSFITAYQNNGTALVTRRDDVIEVLDRHADFEVVCEPKMRAITGGENFFLGMQDTALYTRDVSNMRLAVRRDDVALVVEPLARGLAERLVAGKAGRIDVPPELSLPVPTAIVTEYLGVTGAADTDLMDWATLMFRYLFADIQGDPQLEREALAAAAACCAAIDAAVTKRKAAGQGKDDVLGRCLAMQLAGMPGMDDLGIRNNFIGLVIGAIPTISRAAVQVLDELLRRPEAFNSAQKAARDGDDALFSAHVFEAFRFNPINPVIMRRAARNTKVAAGSFRARRIPKGTMVLAANFSAMFDPLKIDSPESFCTSRPWGDYILWGYGMHGCFGAHINRAVIPAILKPLLIKPGLRRAAGEAGQIDSGGTQFPKHFVVEWNEPA